MAKILFFIKGMVPTPEEEAEAAKLNTRMFRNASLFNPAEGLEFCDAVAGCAPQAYIDKLAKQEIVPAPLELSKTPAATIQFKAPPKPWSK